MKQNVTKKAGVKAKPPDPPPIPPKPPQANSGLVVTKMELKDVMAGQYVKFWLRSETALEGFVVCTAPSWSSIFHTSGAIATPSVGTASGLWVVHNFNPLSNTTIVEVHSSPAIDYLRKQWVEAMRAQDLQNYLKPWSTTLGSDPEVFGVGKNGAVIPAWKWLNKKTPNWDAKINATSHPYWDGWQAEFRIAPGFCMAYATDRIHEGLQQCQLALHRYDPTAHLSIDNLVQVSEDDLRNETEEHVQLGCAPSYNAYDLKSELCGHYRSNPLRSAGFHKHYGLISANPSFKPEMVPAIIQDIDRIAGVASVSLFAGLEHPARRRFYGLPGEYRHTPYGFEYRSDGTAAFCSPVIHHLYWELQRLVVQYFPYGLSQLLKGSTDEAVGIMRNLDVPAARQWLLTNKEFYKWFMGLASPLSAYYPLAWKTFTEGAATVVAEPHNIAKNWFLHNTHWQSNCRAANTSWASAAYQIQQRPSLKV